MIFIVLYIVISIVAFFLTIGSSYFEYEEIKRKDIEEGILVALFWFPIISLYLVLNLMFVIDDFLLKRK